MLLREKSLSLHTIFNVCLVDGSLRVFHKSAVEKQAIFNLCCLLQSVVSVSVLLAGTNTSVPAASSVIAIEMPAINKSCHLTVLHYISIQIPSLFRLPKE